MKSAEHWAELEFGRAELGDARRTRRLVALAAEVASRPAGKVTQACQSSASREGAFRLLENPAVRPEPITRAIVRRTVGRCQGHRLVHVPIDATSLTLTDEAGNKGFGAVGSWRQGSRGIHVMTVFAVAQDGCPIGVCGQQFWVRGRRSNCADRDRSGDLKNRETRFWLDGLRDAHEAFAESAPDCTPWYQLDRGADCWPVLALARELELLLTVRAAHDRCLDGRASHLWSTVERTGVLGHVRVEVPARPPRRRCKRKAGRRIYWKTPPRPARIAKLAVRAATVPIRLTTANRESFTVEMNAVLVREVGRSRDRLEWLLLTTHPVETRANAVAVVQAYTHRWRIEELHRTWKRGLCRVEDTQLRSRDAVFKWATLLVAVASRAMRLTHLARSKPDNPASEEMTRTELDALIAMRQPKGIPLECTPTLAQAVQWLAEIGGYTGPWNGPPGPTVVGRGLHDVLVAARAFKNRDKMR